MQLRYRSSEGRLALTASILGSGMAFLDTTAVNVVLPALDADLGTGFSGLQWILNGYLLAMAALVLPAGSLADRYGRRRVFLAGVLWFALASMLCGIAPTTGVLIAARVLQGIGAALLVPSSLAMLQGAFEAHDRSEAIGAWSGFSGLTTIIGPLLGGWFADAWSWRMVFLINPLLAIVTVIITWRWMPESRDPHGRKPDFAGVVASVVSLGGIIYALIEGPVHGWSHPPIVGSLIAGVVGAIVFVLIERRVPDPMVPLQFFRRVRFSGVTAATMLIYFGLGGVMFLLTLQLQRVLGYSAFAAGAALLPVTLMMLVLSPIAGRLAQRVGPRWLMTLGPLTAALAVALMSRVQVGTTYVGTILPTIIVFGFGLSATVAPLTATAMSALDEEHAGLASGMSNAVTRVAQLMSVAVLPFLAGLSGLDAIGGDAFAVGFARAMFIGAAVMSVGAIIVFVTVRGALATTEDGT